MSDELIAKINNRTKGRTSADDRIRSGGKPKYLLSGLLKCGCCNQNFVMANRGILTKRTRQQADRTEQRPKELRELDVRIERLRERLKVGDPDMAADELQAAIDRALSKRKELEAALPEVKQSAKLLAALPRAAALYKQQIELGLDGDPRAALKARVILRQIIGGRIVLRPGPDRSVWAEYELQPGALLRVGTGGGAEGDRGFLITA